MARRQGGGGGLTLALILALALTLALTSTLTLTPTLTLTLTLTPTLPLPLPLTLGSVCYVVAQGELAVVSGGVPVDTIKSGDVFGESAMIYDVRHLVGVQG